MARTQTNQFQIKDRVLTGASFVPEMKIYDETSNYGIGDECFWLNSKYIANTSITGTTEGDMTNKPDSSGDWDESVISIYSAYPGGTITVNDTARVNIPFDAERFNSNASAFTLASGEITFNASGTFLISLSMSFLNISDTRDTAYSYLQLDTGTGFNDIPNYTLYNYVRNATDGYDTSSILIPVGISTGNKIRVQSIGRGTNDLNIAQSGCNIAIFPIASVSGPQGSIGPAGPPGDLVWRGVWSAGTYNQYDTVEYSGSTYTCLLNGTTSTPPETLGTDWDLVASKGADGVGATIAIQDEGIGVPNTPHDTLNFVGDNVKAVDAGSGVSTITINKTKQSYMLPIWAEENAALVADGTEWAYGNGAQTDATGGIVCYVPTGYTCAVVAMSLCLRQGTATVELVYNGVAQGANANVAVSSGTTNTNDSFTPINVSNGDLLNFRTQLASGTGGPNTVTMWLKYMES